jgi:hypothetical protein
MIIVKPDGKVITIEPPADDLGVEETEVFLNSFQARQTRRVQTLFTHSRFSTKPHQPNSAMQREKVAKTVRNFLMNIFGLLLKTRF